MLSKAQTFWPMILSVFTVIGGMGIGGMLKAWLDHKRGVRKQTDEVALTMLAQVNARVEVLETAREQDHAQCEKQLAVHRHRINNLASMLDSLLMLWDMPAAKTKEAVQRIRERRAQMERAEAIEKPVVASSLVARPAPRHIEMEDV
jgi:hypothetical protein